MQYSESKWVYPATLRRAREELGFSPEEIENLSATLGEYYSPIQARLLKEWESGDSEPGIEDLETLSEIYVRPVGHFLLAEPPQQPWPLSYRGLAHGKQDRLDPQSRQTLRRFVELAEWTKFVIEKHGIDWEIGILPGKSPLDAVGQAREAGERLGFHPALRRTWATPDEAFLWWRRRIEDQGVFCFQMKLEPGDVRGCALWLDSHYPFILVNHHGAEAATGRTFTLLHEYAHLLTATGGLVCDFRGASEADNPEGFANQFAARMLITHDELRHQLDDLGQRSYRDAWPDDVLDQIRAPFFVSRDVVAITLEQLNLAPKGLYQVKRAQWEARRPWGRGGPNRKAMTKKERKLRELGFSLSRVLSRPDMASAIPLTDLCSVLDMKVEKVHDFLSWVRTAMDNE